MQILKTCWMNVTIMLLSLAWIADPSEEALIRWLWSGSFLVNGFGIWRQWRRDRVLARSAAQSVRRCYLTLSQSRQQIDLDREGKAVAIAYIGEYGEGEQELLALLLELLKDPITPQNQSPIIACAGTGLSDPLCRDLEAMLSRGAGMYGRLVCARWQE